MPLLHCNRCHHEWEGKENSECDWCGGTPLVLEEETHFEKAIRIMIEKVREKNKKKLKKV